MRVPTIGILKRMGSAAFQSLEGVPAVEIAVGGMKTISRVHDCKADRYVAMATLHDGAGEELFEPFLREACLTARLEHPNIGKISIQFSKPWKNSS